MLSTFAERLCTVRRCRLLTQGQLARRCGFARSTIARYEKGEIDVSGEHARVLGRALDVTAGFFINDGVYDHRSLDQLLADESLECFLQTSQLGVHERAALRRITRHPASPKTVEEWKRLERLAADGLLALAEGDHAERFSDRRFGAEPALPGRAKMLKADLKRPSLLKTSTGGR